MKTILIPTDFSLASMGAAVYGAELAKLSSANILLFHAYHPPLPTAANEFIAMPEWDLDRENLVLLENFARELRQKVVGSYEITCRVKLGFAVEEIIWAGEDNNVDLIVMGISGSGRLSEFLMGSNTTGVIQKTNIPVLIIPPKASFKKMSDFVFAYDYKSEIAKNVLLQLKKFIHDFKANLNILNLEKPEEGIGFEKAVNGMLLENALSDVVHTLHFLPKIADIATEMNDFVDTHESDILIVVPHRYNILKGIFHQSVTKHLAFHSHIPILALHD
ncbi:MAG: universal stress protein [Bacteroidetes bacterium]|nr:universal stress protein [Bacteroidota bacterium]